jgi:hypothetical protein
MDDLQDLLDLNPEQRGAFVRYARHEAHEQAEYARMDLRHSMLTRPVEVETQNERWAREAAEKEEQRRREKAEREHERKICERRAHQIALAQAQAQNPMNGVNWADLLREIGDAIGALTDRVEELENRLDALENGNGNGTAASKHNFRLVHKRAKRAPAASRPARYPWSSKVAEWPGLRISEPRITRR